MALSQSGQRSPAEWLRLYTELLYPIALLLAFIASSAFHSVVTSRSEEELTDPGVTGPDGKPLPIGKKRREADDFGPTAVHSGRQAQTCFQLTTALLIGTFVLNGLAIAVHAIKARESSEDSLTGWWCGEERVVYVVGSLALNLYVLITLLDWNDSPNVVHAIYWSLAWFGEMTILGTLMFSILGVHHEIDDVRGPTFVTVRGPTFWDILDFSTAVVRVVLVAGCVLLFILIASRRRRAEAQRHTIEESFYQNGFDEASGLLDSRHCDRYNYRSCENDRRHGRRSRAGSDCVFTNGPPNCSRKRTLSDLCHEHESGLGDGNDIENRKDGDGGKWNGAGNEYGDDAAGGDFQHRDETAAFYRPEKLPHKTWYEYCRGYKVFFPYLWPSKSTKLQGIVLVCFILELVQRLVNILVPLQTGRVTDMLADKVRHKAAYDAAWTGARMLFPMENDWVNVKTANRSGMDFWQPVGQLMLLVMLKMMQGPSGLLGSARGLLWVPVSQHTYRALTTAAFEHVHSLSLDFHLGKRTGEVLSALNKGASINQFLEQMTFQVVPMLIDLLIAVFFFYFRFGATYAMYVAIITFYYLYLTIRMAATRADQRRDMVNADREEEAVKNDSITSYETVKYFNAERYEFQRYRDAIKKFQWAEAKVTLGINVMNMCQSMVFMIGILVAMITCSFEVYQGLRTVGAFVLLTTYLAQLQGPLNFFGTFYRTVQQAMISGERLLELFKIQPTVVDQPAVEPVQDTDGHIRWNEVGFAYDQRKPALLNISFDCKPGTTTAFVGESGGGKSTIFRLMFRYYNTSSGSIEIDGHDVKSLSIDSVRRLIGVVPQDTLLFNETLMYNLKYANQDATDQQVYEACQAAAIHDRIMSFPDGYNTKVGERGLRLSGGEKQRVAIARTILKNPRIIMLDEATSALDGETEQKIQARLISGGHLGEGRTLMIIAHRLSTITHADQIVVLHAGEIVEKGTHEELLKRKGGRYASMWEKHCRAERAAEVARAATTKAEKLMRQANLHAKKTSNASSCDGCHSMVSSTMLHTEAESPDETDNLSRHNSSPDLSSESSNSSTHGDDDVTEEAHKNRLWLSATGRAPVRGGSGMQGVQTCGHKKSCSL